jgi:uncharacterized membrane protein YvlD (DUF360 family)
VIRLLVRTGIALAANAVGLLVAAAVLDGFRVEASGFILAVVIFTVVFALLQPFLVVQIRRLGSGAALGGVALIATLASLIVTDLISDGFSIDGFLGLDRGDRHRVDRLALRGVHPALPRAQEVPRGPSHLAVFAS